MCPPLYSSPRLRDNSCSPKLRMCCGLGTSGEDPRQETRPRIARLLSQPVALALPTPRGHPQDLLGRVRRTPFIPFFPPRVGRGRDDSCSARWARVLHLPNPGLSAARAEVLAPRRPGSPGHARGLQRGDLPSETGECVTRPLIFAARRESPGFLRSGGDLCLPWRAGPSSSGGHWLQEPERASPRAAWCLEVAAEKG